MHVEDIITNALLGLTRVILNIHLRFVNLYAANLGFTAVEMHTSKFTTLFSRRFWFTPTIPMAHMFQ